MVSVAYFVAVELRSEIGVNVRAFITPTNPNQLVSHTSGMDHNLEIIIIIAIVVACLAFGLLIFAVAWACKTDQTKWDAYNKLDHRSLQQPTDGGSGQWRNLGPIRR